MKEFKKGDLVNWHSAANNVFWCIVINKVYPNQYRLISSGGSILNIDEERIENTNIKDVVENNRKAWGCLPSRTINEIKQIYAGLGIVCPEEIINLEKEIEK